MNHELVSLLVVEDDDVAFMSVQRAMKRARIANPIHRAIDGVEAFEMLRGQAVRSIRRPFLILLDLNMPRMGGLDFLKELRADPDLRSAIVFVLSTSSADSDISAAYEYNIAGYIQKSDVGSGFRQLVDALDAFWTVVTLPK